MKIFLAIAMLLFSLNVSAKSLFSNDTQAEAGKYMSALKDLIVASQRTRGAVSSYLNGNSMALQLVYDYQSDMKKAIGKMESLPFAQNPVINARAASVTRNLISLNNESLDMKPAQSFKKYTENLAQALMLAQTVSKQFKDLNEFGYKAVDLMLNVILPLSEEMGQLRALGSGVAAKKGISPREKALIKAKLRNIRNLSMNLKATASALNNTYTDLYSADYRMRLEQAIGSASSISRLTESEILSKNPVTYDSNKFFSRATDAVDDVIVLFDRNAQAVLKDSDGWL